MTKCRAGFAIGRGGYTATFLANCLEISLGAGIYFLKRIFIDCSTEILRDKLPGLLLCGHRKRGHAKRVQAYQNSCVAVYRVIVSICLKNIMFLSILYRQNST